jgi:hypothetical protein
MPKLPLIFSTCHDVFQTLRQLPLPLRFSQPPFRRQQAGAIAAAAASFSLPLPLSRLQPLRLLSIIAELL